MTSQKCFICNTRPATSSSSAMCHNCRAKIGALKSTARQTEPFKYVTYQGSTVALVKNKAGRLSPVMTKRTKFPKSKLINLDTYCEGFTREQIKNLKRVVLGTWGVRFYAGASAN